MAQKQLNFPPPSDGSLSGTDGISTLEDYGEAEASGHLGTERPNYITKGGKWTKDNQDGSLSLMVCLNEDTDVEYDKIINDGRTTGLPKGGIIMWSGSISAIPTGWALCNGQNGTPDLRNRFIVGAGSSYAVGDKGGAVEKETTSNGAHTHSFSKTTSSNGAHTHKVTGNAKSHTLSIAQIPSHYHGLPEGGLDANGDGSPNSLRVDLGDNNPYGGGSRNMRAGGWAHPFGKW